MKKLLAMMMVLALCVTLFAACAGSDDSNNNTGAGDAGTTDGGDSTDGDSTEGSAGGADASNGVVTVGILAPLTGDVAEYGVAVRNGAKLYIDQYNAAGGLSGKLIAIEEYDEEGDPEKAMTGYNALVDRGITGLIGDVTTAPTLAVVPLAFEDNMPMITASATAAAVTVNEDTGDVYTNMFRSCFIDPFQGEKMADFANAELGATTAAVLYNTGSDYSIGLKDAFVSKAAELGMTVVAEEGYADGAVDFQGQLTNIAAQSPDVLFVPDYYNIVALVGPQAQSAGLDAALLGGDGWDTVLTVVDDPATIEGSYYCSGYSTADTDPAVQAFLSDYQAAYGHEPNMFAAQGYDAAMILVAALEQAEAQGLEAASDDYKQAVIDAIKATDMDCVTGHVVFNSTNDPEKSAVIINITGGEAQFWGKY